MAAGDRRVAVAAAVVAADGKHPDKERKPMNQTIYRRQSNGAIPDVIFILLMINGLVFVG